MTPHRNVIVTSSMEQISCVSTANHCVPNQAFLLRSAWPFNFCEFLSHQGALLEVHARHIEHQRVGAALHVDGDAVARRPDEVGLLALHELSRQRLEREVVRA